MSCATATSSNSGMDEHQATASGGRLGCEENVVRAGARTTAERGYIAYNVAVIVLAVLVLVPVLAVVMILEGGFGTASLVLRLMTLSFAGLAVIGLIVYVKAAWRRVLAGPAPVKGISGWFERQPGWRLVLIYWAMVAVPGAVAAFVAGSGMHHRSALEWPFAVEMVAVGAFTGVGLAARQRVISQRRQGAPGRRGRGRCRTRIAWLAW